LENVVLVTQDTDGYFLFGKTLTGPLLIRGEGWFFVVMVLEQRYSPHGYADLMITSPTVTDIDNKALSMGHWARSLVCISFG